MLDEIKNSFIKQDITNVEKIKIGSQNHIYKIETSNDKYIIKLFNKDTISNKKEEEIREKKEIIASIASKNGINTIVPLKFNNKFIQNFQNNYFCIYKYCNFSSIVYKDMTITKIQNLSNTINKLHNLKFDVELPKITKKITIDFDYYLNIFLKTNQKLYEVLYENKIFLSSLINEINRSLNNLTEPEVINHNDIKHSNVLWNKDEPILVDWDATNYINPFCALNEYAYFWSINKNQLNTNYYEVFLTTYLKNNSCKDNFQDVIYGSLYGKMSWFNYSLNRCTSDNSSEKKEGINSIHNLINDFNYYVKNIPVMLNIYNNIKNNL